MTIKVEISGFGEIAEMAWSGAFQVCQEIIMQDREEEAMALIEEIFFDSVPSATELNDFIWFELADMMDLYKEDDEEDTEEE